MNNFTITDKELRDYMFCPAYYDFKYNNKNLANIERKKTENEMLNKVVLSFCASIMDGELLSPKAIKRKWNLVCKNNQDMTNEKIAEGFSKLMSFYRWAEDQEINVIDALSRYRVKFFINKNSVDLTGDIGIIAMTKDKKFEELVVDFSNRRPNQVTLDRSLKFSLSHVGFYYSLPEEDRIELIGTRIFHVKSGEEFYTVRDPRVEAKKIARLSYNVARAINDKIFYPAESPMCSTYCPADTFCAMWGTPSLEKNGDDIL